MLLSTACATRSKPRVSLAGSSGLQFGRGGYPSLVAQLCDLFQRAETVDQEFLRINSAACDFQPFQNNQPQPKPINQIRRVLINPAQCPLRSESDRNASLPRTDAMVELRMGAVAWGLWPTLRFPSPLIKPNVPISGIRLSDWFTVRHAASELTASGFGTVGHSPSPRDTAVSDGACLGWCSQAHRQSPRPPHLRMRTRSQGPFLHWRYPASTVV